MNRPLNASCPWFRPDLGLRPAQIKDMEAAATQQQAEVARFTQEAAEASHLLADGLVQAEHARAAAEQQAVQITDLTQQLQVRQLQFCEALRSSNRTPEATV